MSQFRKSLIEELMLTLKIPQGNFNYSTIEDEIKHIPQDKLREFYKSVMSVDSFGNGMKAIIEASKLFTSKVDIYDGSRDKAKSMYDKFYVECCRMLDYCTDNREKINSDREFFTNCDYASLKNKLGESAYTKQELYVLNDLGSGEWLCNIRLYPNSEVAITAIEKSIKKAITTKYSTNAIENKKVRDLIGMKK